MTKYVLNYWVYGIVALIFAGLYALITWSLCWEMFPIALCTLYLVRAADDYHDYDTDQKEKPLSRQQLRNLIIGLAVIFLLLQKKGLSLRRGRFLVHPLHLILLLMTAELIGNSIYAVCTNGRITRSLYLEDVEDMREYRALYGSEEKPYRTEIGQIKGRDDVTRYHLNSLSFFSSTCDDRLEDLMDALGLYKAGNKFTYEGATPLTDAMLGIRYVASKEELSAYNLKMVDQI